MKLIHFLFLSSFCISASFTQELNAAHWVKSNCTDRQVPSSPNENFETTTILPEESTDDPEVNDDEEKIDYKKPGTKFVYKNAVDLSTGYTPGYCRCVPRYYCGPQDKAKDLRAVNTASCKNRDEVMCCRTNGPGCGVPADFPYFNPLPNFGESNFGDYPWTAIVMDTNNQYIFGIGTIISWKVVLTTARNIAAYAGTDLKVRLGEWDLATSAEPFKPEEIKVSQVVIHPKYDPRTFQNDIAVLLLNTSIDLSGNPGIRSACIARPQDKDKFNGAKCLSAGWGQSATRVVTEKRNLMKEVDMEVLEGSLCQYALRKVVGNTEYYLDQQSFLCAGGEKGKGLCKGDEGAALVCKEKESSRFVAVGISSWGTTCGEPGFPNVFTNLANYYDWIKSVAPDIGQYD